MTSMVIMATIIFEYDFFKLNTYVAPRYQISI